jgi:hypothetical protein
MLLNFFARQLLLWFPPPPPFLLDRKKRKSDGSDAEFFVDLANHNSRASQLIVSRQVSE